MPQTQKIVNNEPRLISIRFDAKLEALDLRPGVNEVDAAAWEKAKQLSQVKIWMRTPTLNPETKPGKMIEESAAARIDLLPGTFDLKLLGKWLADETDGETKQAIGARIAELEEQAKKARKAG